MAAPPQPAAGGACCAAGRRRGLLNFISRAEGEPRTHSNRVKGALPATSRKHPSLRQQAAQPGARHLLPPNRLYLTPKGQLSSSAAQQQQGAAIQPDSQTAKPTCSSMECPARSSTMRISAPPCRGREGGAWQRLKHSLRQRFEHQLVATTSTSASLCVCAVSTWVHGAAGGSNMHVSRQMLRSRHAQGTDPANQQPT